MENVTDFGVSELGTANRPLPRRLPELLVAESLEGVGGQRSMVVPVNIDVFHQVRLQKVHEVTAGVYASVGEAEVVELLIGAALSEVKSLQQGVLPLPKVLLDRR